MLGLLVPAFQNIISIIMRAWPTQGIPFDSLGLYLSKETSHTMVLCDLEYPRWPQPNGRGQPRHHGRTRCRMEIHRALGMATDLVILPQASTL